MSQSTYYECCLRDDFKRLLKWVQFGIPYDKIHQKLITDISQYSIFWLLPAGIIEMMFEPLYPQDIDKALYVAEFHQEEEQEEC